MYRADSFHDCVPIQSPAVIQQQNLATIAAHYVDTSGTTGGQSTQDASTQALQPVTPVTVPPIASSGLLGGLDLTTLLVIGAVLFFVMKK